MRDTGPVRVAVVEDEDFMRDLLRIAFAQSPGIEVRGVYPDADAALQAVPTLDVQAAILDIDLGPGLNGIQLGLLLREQCPDLGVVLLSNHFVPRFMGTLPAEQMRGWCYLLKKSLSDVASLERAIKGAASGLMVLDPQVVAGRKPRSPGALERLTKRQHEILGLLAQGYSNSAIAERLTLSVGTVENQIDRIYSELGVTAAGSPEINPRVRAVLCYLLNSRAGDDPGFLLDARRS